MKNALLKILALQLLVTSAGVAATWNYTPKALKNCQGGLELVASFPFQDGAFSDSHDFVVFSEGFRTLDAIVAKIKAKGFEPVAVWNGGFFGPNNAVSYYKSSLTGVEHYENSQRGPRACTLFDHGTNSFNLLQSTTTNYQNFLKLNKTEVFCAGPQLLQNGLNVAKQQYCDEQFNPSCRPDRTDPGIGYNSNYPRTASCFTAAGEFKVFAYLSTFKKCGSTVEHIADRMLDEGCVEGMNHDGGGSSKIYLNNGTENFYRGFKGDANRTIPVWVAVVKKPKVSKSKN